MAANFELIRLTSRVKKDGGQYFDDDDENSNSENDEEVDHEKLLKKIKSLDKKGTSKRHRGPLRSELNQNVSEFHLKSEGDDGHVNLQDLVGSLQTSSYHSKLKKSLESLQRMGRTVEVPLSKPAAEQIQRVVAYEETSKDISKWEATVQKNRRADQLSFPLDPYKPAEMSTTTLTTTFKPRTPLEQEIASVLHNSSQMLEREDKELSLEEEEALKNMSLEEALERRHELQKLRALQSYYEQKCRRMKKIKSKKYHRIKRKAEKRTSSKQTFEQLREENPELAQAELQKAEKLRITERMSLKHRNTSKWAKNIIAKGINDVQARQALSEQLRLSRQLTETKTAESDSDEDETKKAEEENTKIPDNFRNFGLVGDSLENPWLLSDGKGTGKMDKDIKGQENTKERLRKPKPVTAEETEVGQNGGQDEGERDSENSDPEENFELMNEKDVQENCKKEKKLKKKKSIDRKKNEDNENKAKKRKMKGKKLEIVEEEVMKTNQKKGDLKGNIEETNDVERKTERKKKRVKRKITEEKQMNQKSKKTKKAKLVNSGVEEDIGEETGPIGDTEDHEELLLEGDGIEDLENSSKNLVQDLDTDFMDPNITDNVSNTKSSFILNPKNVFQIEDLSRQNDLLHNTVDDSDDDTHAQRMTIQEAFANDDVIEEFVKEKEDEAEASKPKDLDLSLPGWGDWGGPGIDETKRRKKFVAPAKPAPPRKDTKLAHVIINEKRDKKFAKNQVSQLPFPFTSPDQWERSVRVPLGKDWNTTSVHQKLVKPRVVTLPGTIIEPIKPAKGVGQSTVVEDSSNRHGGRRKGAKTIGSGIEIHN